MLAACGYLDWQEAEHQYSRIAIIECVSWRPSQTQLPSMPGVARAIGRSGEEPNLVRHIKTLLFVLVLLGCTLVAVRAGHAWIRAASVVVLACMLVALLVEWLDALLPRLAVEQRWRYKLMPLSAAETLLVSNESINGKDVERLLAHEHASRRGGSAMRRLIAWWQAPCAECHQESMEADEVYLRVAPATARLLSVPLDVVRQRARWYVDEAMRHEQEHGAAWSVARLRAMIVPIVIRLYHELVFGKECPPDKVPMFAASVANVMAATSADSRYDTAARCHVLGAFMTIERIRKSVIKLINMPRNARDAFGGGARDGGRWS
ncbi:hypothetical protein ACMHYB_38615 [Sorangium sp. So ce1128]